MHFDHEIREEMEYFPHRFDKPKVLFDFEYEGKRLIGYNLGTHPVAYVGLPKKSILSGVDYMELDFIYPPHGGFTFADYGDGKYLPEGYYFLGWDYSHHSDFFIAGTFKNEGRKYTTREILLETVSVAETLTRLETFIVQKIVDFLRNPEIGELHRMLSDMKKANSCCCGGNCNCR